jgi:NAD(P)-dependent dehydrogenase (short-subunit alcohol dehydrogenase family)
MMDKILIIGGNSGIGMAFADLQSITDLIEYRPTQQGLDVTHQRQVRDYIANSGPFRYIVYSAGINHLRWIQHYPGGNPLPETLDVNVTGFVNIVSEHVSQWPNRKVSAVAISSDAGERPMRGSLAYCVSKAALDMAIKCMARELAPLWRVNGVAPGMVEGTPMTKYIDETVFKFRGWAPEYAEAYEKASVPTGRRATLEEVAETIRWVLTGPEQINGEIIKVNGGRT